MSNIPQLPKEVLGIILSFITDPKTLYAVDCSSKKLHSIVKDKNLWVSSGCIYKRPPPKSAFREERLRMGGIFEYSDPDDSMEGGMVRCFCLEADCCYSLYCPCVCLYHVCCFPILMWTGCVRCRRRGPCICPCLVPKESYYDDGDDVCCCCFDTS